MLNRADVISALTMEKDEHDLDPDTPLSERQAEEIGKFKINVESDEYNCNVTKVVFLPRGVLVVWDVANGCLKLFTETGDFLDRLLMPENVADLCRVDGNTVALLVSCPTKVQLVDVSLCKLSLSYDIAFDEYDGSRLTYSERGYFILSSKTDACSLSKDGQVNHLHRYVANIGRTFNIIADKFGENMLVCLPTYTKGEPAVCRVSGGEQTTLLEVGALRSNGGIIPRGTEEIVLRGAEGIDFDQQGNVYVCGCMSNNVIRMSKDGTNVIPLLTSSNSHLDSPLSISVCGNRFVVTHLGGKDRNDIRLFRLA